MIYILTGNGKGKTTSAIGMGLRAVGAGKKVLMIQFLKTESSENKIIEKIKNFDIRTFGRKGFFLPKSVLKKQLQLRKKGIKPLTEKDFELAKQGFSLARKAAQSKRYNILILDEICVALKFSLIDIEMVLDFLRKYQKKLDIILTGRNAPQTIIKIADLVTEMKEVKHYYQKGIGPRPGIEF